MTSARVRSFREASRAALASVRRNMRHVVKHRIAAHTVLPKLKARRISRPPKPSNATANVAVGFGAGARVRWALKGETGHPALKEPMGRSVLKGPTGHPALTGLTGRSVETLPPLTDPTPLMTGLRLVTPLLRATS